MKRLPMRKIKEVLRLKAEGLSTRQISSSSGVGRTTLREHLYRAEQAGVSWPLPDDVTDGDLERQLFPRHPDHGSRVIPQPDFAGIHRELRRKGVTLQLLWEEYRAVYPDGYGYSWYLA